MTGEPTELTEPTEPAAFSNASVELTGHPQLRDTDFRPLERKLLTLRLMLLAIPAALLLLAGLVLTVFLDGPGWLGPLVIVAALTLSPARAVATRLSFAYWGYAVREHDLTVRKGVIIRTAITVPFNRVQHASVHSGPLERNMGLSTIRVFTAGGAGADLSIEGLTAEAAGVLKDQILARVAAAGPSSAL